MKRPLAFIIGEPGSGKTSVMTEKIKALAEKGKNVTVIVPEQFSSSAENKLYDALGIVLFNKIHVETFTRIRRGIIRSGMNVGGNIPSEAAKAAVMYTVRRSLAKLEDNEKGTLKHFSRQVKNPAFTSVCLNIVRELEMNGIQSGVLVSGNIKDAALRDKIKDIDFICGEYDRRLSECGYRSVFADREAVASAAAENEFFKNTYIFIDQFKSFTADQIRLIGVMKSQTSVTICMPTPYENINSSPVFASVNETIEDITRGDGAEFIKAAGNKDRFEKAPDIRQLSRSVLRGEETEPFASEHIHIAAAPDPRAESDYVCADISRRVRNGEYRYGDMAIVTRDFENLKSILEDSFIKYEIPFFMDSPSPVSSRPLIIFAMTVMEAASAAAPSVETVLRLMKTGFAGITEKHIAELEDYYITHGIIKEDLGGGICPNENNISYDTLKEYDSGSLSENEPKGFEILSGRDRKSRSLRAEIIREAVIIPLRELREGCGDTLREMTAAVCAALNKFLTVRKTLAGLRSESEEGREMAGVKKALETILQNISDVPLSSEYNSFTLKEYREIFGMIAAKTSLSFPAHSANCVTASSADRARLDSPKVVYIMGAANGFFPFAVKESGIFSEKELKILEDAIGVRFNERIFRMTAEENFIAVNCIAAPSEELYITYALSDRGGKSRYPAPLTDSAEKLAKTSVTNISDLPSEFFITTPRSAYSEFVRSLGKSSGLTPEKSAAALKAYEKETGALMLYAEKYAGVIAEGGWYKYRISSENAQRIYIGKNGNMNISASRLEDMAVCPFKFFCKKGLGLSNVTRHEYNALVRGNAVHFIMRKVLSAIVNEAAEKNISFNLRISQYDEDAFIQAIHSAMTDYINESFPENEYEFSPLFKNSLYIQEKAALEILLKTRAEFSPENSKFRPAEFEYSIGIRRDEEEPDAPPMALTVDIDGDKKINVSFTGSVDRIDVFTDRSSGNDVNYLRVTDYKTGAKKFSLNDILDGLNMQVLLYLEALTGEAAADKYKEYLPAGVLYSPSRMPPPRKLENGERIKSNSEKKHAENAIEALKHIGFTLNDVNVIRSMEYGAAEVYIPVKLNTANAAEYVKEKGGALRRECGIEKQTAAYAKLLADNGHNISEDDLTAELCAAADEKLSLEEAEKRVTDKYGIAADLKKETEKFVGEGLPPLFSGNENILAAVREFMDVYNIYTRFDENFPDTADERQELERRFMSDSKGNIKYPSSDRALSEDEMRNTARYAKKKMGELCADICGGNAAAMPYSVKGVCEYCEYRAMCENCVPSPDTVRRKRYTRKEAAEEIGNIRKEGDVKK